MFLRRWLGAAAVLVVLLTNGDTRVEAATPTFLINDLFRWEILVLFAEPSLFSIIVVKIKERIAKRSTSFQQAYRGGN